MNVKGFVWRDCFRVALVAVSPNCRKLRILSILSATASTSLVLLAAHAQATASIQFQTPIALLSPASLSNPEGPFGVALSAGGDLFVSDFNNDRVLEIPSGCTSTACQATLPTNGLSGPTGIAVDGAGDVFIADYNNNRVVELPWSGNGFGPQITLPDTGQNFPSGVAVDKAGDLFIANDDYTGTTANRVMELPWTGSGYGTPITAVSWLNGPFGLAFDASDNLFIADYSDNEVVELPNGCSSSACQTMIANGAALGPTAVSVDQASDVFVSYFGSDKVIEVPAGCSSSACEIYIAIGLNQPAGVTVDKAGNIFIADYGNSRILKVGPNSFDLGSVSIGSTASVTAFVNFNSPTVLNTSTPYSVVAQGSSGLDFGDAGGGSCTGTTYSSGQSCSVTINFKPRLAGRVTGALVLFDASGNDIAAGYLTGVGSGPQLTFLPGARSSLGVRLASTTGVATNRNGDIFVADESNRTIEELLAPTYTTARQLGGGFNFTSPVGLALDGAGNVFVADTGAAVIYEIHAPDYATVSMLGSGFSNPSGVAVDGRGNVYIADAGHSAIKEILEASGYTTIDTLGSGFNAPTGVAVDGNGNVYIADTGNGAVKEILSLDGSIPTAPTIKSFANSFSAPAGIAVDGIGNVYVADSGNGALDELAAASGFSSVNQLDSGVGGLTGVAVDSGGNVYAGSSANPQVVKLDYADPPSLNFEASVGKTSSAQSVTVTNYGNADLTFATPTSGYNPDISSEFSIQTNESTGSSCPVLTTYSGAATLAPGASCVDQLTFNPNSTGVVNGSMVIIDNDLNQTGSKQTISLNGATLSILLAPISLAAAQVGIAYSQMLDASGGSAPYTYKVTTGSLPPGLSLSTAGMLSGTPTAGGSFTFAVTATDAANSTGSQPYSITVSAPDISVTPPSLSAAQVNVSYKQELTASGGTAPYSYKVTAGSLPDGLTFDDATATLSGTPTAGGSFPFTVTVTDSSTGSGPYTYSITLILTVSPGATFLNFAPISPQTYGNPPFTVSASSASSGAITYSVVSGPATINPTSGLVNLAGAGQVMVEASQASTASYDASVSQMSIAVAKQSSITIITASSNSVATGQSVTLTAAIAPTISGIPTGTVIFMDDGTQIGTPVTVTNAMAQLVMSKIPAGQHRISAVYSGDSNFLESSAALSVPILVSPSGFSFTVTGTTSAAVGPGGTAVFNFALAPSYANYPATVTFSVNGLPPGASSSFSATSVPSNAGPQTIALSITVSSGNSASAQRLNSNRRYSPLAFAMLLPLLGLRRFRFRRKKLLNAMRLIIFLAAGALTTSAFSGCASVSGVLGSSYSVAVTATSDTMQQTAFVNVIVK